MVTPAMEGMKAEQVDPGERFSLLPAVPLLAGHDVARGELSVIETLEHTRLHRHLWGQDPQGGPGNLCLQKAP